MNLARTIRKAMRFCNRWRKLLLAVFGLLGLIFFFFYMRGFLQTGVDFDGAFLEKGDRENGVLYAGENLFGTVIIEVEQHEHSATVYYTVPQNKRHPFSVAFSPYSEFWQNVRITDGWTNEVLFEGRFQRGNRFLYDTHGNPVYGETDQTASGDNPYINFSPNLRKLAGFAAGEYERTGGNWLLLIPAILLILAVFVHVRWPMLTMRIEYAVFGREPLPGEARMFVHTLAHTVLLFAAAVLLILAK